MPVSGFTSASPAMRADVFGELPLRMSQPASTKPAMGGVIGGVHLPVLSSGCYLFHGVRVPSVSGQWFHLCLPDRQSYTQHPSPSKDPSPHGQHHSSLGGLVLGRKEIAQDPLPGGVGGEGMDRRGPPCPSKQGVHPAHHRKHLGVTEFCTPHPVDSFFLFV